MVPIFCCYHKWKVSWSFIYFLAWVHGLLHLLGFDHEISKEAEVEMEREEEILLKSLDWKGKGLIKSACEAETNSNSNFHQHGSDGPVMTKFTIALREIGTYKEVLRSQVEHMLNDRLLQFVNIDLQEVKCEAFSAYPRTYDLIHALAWVLHQDEDVVPIPVVGNIGRSGISMLEEIKENYREKRATSNSVSSCLLVDLEFVGMTF